MQFKPTTCAPASASRWHASATVQSSRVTSALCIASVITAVFCARRITSSAMSASCAHENVSPTTKSTPASTAQPTCSSNIARTALCDVGSVGS
jgi:hypothetical protein